MSRGIVVRASQEPDSPYLIWSTIVDAPTYIFASRDEILDFLREEANRTGIRIPGHLPSDRVERADLNGSSALEPVGDFGWDDEQFLVMNGVPACPSHHYWVLPRTRLADYAKALLADDEATANQCLVLKAWED